MDIIFCRTFCNFLAFLLVGIDYVDPKKKSNVVGKILLAAAFTALCILMLKQSPSFNSPSVVIPLSLYLSYSIFIEFPADTVSLCLEPHGREVRYSCQNYYFNLLSSLSLFCFLVWTRLKYAIENELLFIYPFNVKWYTCDAW